jgi:hypothetical protein
MRSTFQNSARRRRSGVFFSFHHGLVVVFALAVGPAGLAVLASLLRGGRHIDASGLDELPPPA